LRLGSAASPIARIPALPPNRPPARIMLCIRPLGSAARGMLRRDTLSAGSRTFSAMPRFPTSHTPVARPAVQQRGFAFQPRQGRESKVKVAVKEAPKAEWWQQEQTTSTAVSRQHQQHDIDQDQRAGSQYEALTGGVQAHLQKVYATLTAGIGVAAGASMVSMATGLASMLPPIVPGLLAIAPMAYLIMGTNKYTHSSEFRTALFVAFTSLSGMAIAPLLKVFLAINPTAIPLALFSTAGLFGVMTVLSMVAPRGAMLNWGVPLGGGMIMLMLLGLGGMFVPATSAWAPLLHNISLYGGLGLFTLYIAYDTQVMVAEYEMGQDDHLRHAINLFINFQAIFTRLLMIFGMRDD